MKQLLEQWFIRDITGQWYPQKSGKAAELRRLELNKLQPSYGPHRIIFMREAIPPEIFKERKSVSLPNKLRL